EKFVLTIGATTILLLHMPTVGRRSGVEAELIHAGGGMLVLFAAIILSVFKPWGKTSFGRAGQRETPNGTDGVNSTGGAVWGKSVLFVTIGLFALVVILHVAGGGHGGGDHFGH